MLVTFFFAPTPSGLTSITMAMVGDKGQVGLREPHGEALGEQRLKTNLCGK